MKKGQIYEGTVIDVKFPDKAVVLTKETDKHGVTNECHVTVKGALTGQTVKYILQKARAGKCKGRLLEVVEKSPAETAKPECANFGMCGGCSYQTLPYQAQLEFKKNQVLKLLDGVLGEGSYIFDGIFPSPCIWGYRNKMEFSFGDEYKGGPLSLGLHKKGSIHDIINVSGCKIVNNDYSKILDCVREYFLKRNIPHYNKNTHTGILRHLLVRRSASTGEILVALVTASGLENAMCGSSGNGFINGSNNGNINGYKSGVNKADVNEADVNVGNGSIICNMNNADGIFIDKQTRQDGFKNNCVNCLHELGLELQHLGLEGRITGFLHIINDGLGDVVKSDETHIVFGKDWITEEILGLKFRISVFSFFQTNTKGAELLYSCARNYILGKPAVKKGAEEKVKENIRENIGDIEDIKGDVKEDIKEDINESIKTDIFLSDKTVFDLYSGTGTIAQIIAPIAKKVTGVEIVEEAVGAAKQNAEDNGLGNCEFIAGDVLKVLEGIYDKPDFIILDPPREGVNHKALKKIGGDMKVPGMVYISCKPTSLVRDIAELQKYGYKVERVCCVDMFPQTGHVETICKLTLVN